MVKGKSEINPVEKAVKIVNEVLKMVGEEQIHMPATGTTKDRLEVVLDLYAEKLVSKNPQYKAFVNKRDIPEMAVMCLKNLIDKQE